MNIGQAAQASGVSAKMIRYYEAIGLLPEAKRNAAGYRIYQAQDIHGLRFIRRSRDLGFGMAEIAELLALWQDQKRPSYKVKELASAHIAQLETRIADLQSMVNTLQSLVAHCQGDDRPDCPILTDLACQT